jgi:hypothetical protein
MTFSVARKVKEGDSIAIARVSNTLWYTVFLILVYKVLDICVSARRRKET